MFFKVFNKGFAGSNSYILGDGSEAAVIDPGNKAGDIYEEAVKNGFRIKYIILTHGHLDHIMYTDELKRKTNATVAIHEADARALTDAQFNVSAVFGMPKVFQEVDLILRDGDKINFGGHVLTIFHTPGHTPGGICIRCENMLFTGDTLFDGDFGRTDLPGGDSRKLRESLEKIFNMDGSLTIYPGHDSSNKLENIINKCRAGNLLDEDNWPDQ